MKKYLRYLGPILITAIFLLAVYLLYNKLKAYSIAQIRESILQISYGRIGLSLVLMVINYMILVGYDWLALKAIHKQLPLPRVALVSFVGQAVSYNFGALLGGTSVRYRFYSAWGFSLTDIVRLVLMLAVTFWVGAFDIYYAFQDLDFDLAFDLRSVPSVYGPDTALALAAFSHVMTAIFLLLTGLAAHLSWPWYAICLGIGVLLLVEHRLMRPQDLRHVNTAFFTLNGIISPVVLMGVILGIYI